MYFDTLPKDIQFFFKHYYRDGRGEARRSMAELISGAFPWSETQEGQGYWRELSDKSNKEIIEGVRNCHSYKLQKQGFEDDIALIDFKKMRDTLNAL